MEVDNGFGQTVIEKKRDEAAERVQKLFQDFLEEFEIEEDGKKLHKYKILAEELAAPEKNTLVVDIRHSFLLIWVGYKNIKLRILKFYFEYFRIFF